MASISTAIGLERKSRTSGYKLKKGFFSNETENLPQIIAVFAEANTANQSGLTTAKVEVTSEKEAGDLFGYGSPIHQIVRILRPISSDGVGGIPTIIYPQLTKSDSTATVVEFSASGTATSSATHTLVINGREDVNFLTYSFSVNQGDTATDIMQKMADACNSVLASPVIATFADGDLLFTSKWKGQTSADINISVNTNNNTAGITYALVTKTDGAGTVDLADSLMLIGDEWVTAVINSYGETKLQEFENFNGFPHDNAPTGRYQGVIFKPFMAFFGSTKSLRTDLETITNNPSRVNQCTNVLCPAPNSKGMPFEAAANVVALFARVAQDTPHLDVAGMVYPDMPIPTDFNIGDMAQYNNRDLLLKKGCSTVILENGQYQIQDLVTTYHPDGENPLQYNYTRNLNLDWNVKDGYTTLERLKVRDRVLVSDNQVTAAQGVIKPSEWKAVVYEYFDNLAQKALITDPDFSKQSLKVQISSTNPNRLDVFFRYKRTGTVRIMSTDVEAGFN